MSGKREIKGFSCPKCGWSDVLAVEVCPHCLSKVKEARFSGEGRIATFTVIRYPPIGFEDQAPYVVALIDLIGGSRVIGRVKAEPDKVKIGGNVEFTGETAGALEFVLA